MAWPRTWHQDTDHEVKRLSRYPSSLHASPSMNLQFAWSCAAARLLSASTRLRPMSTPVPSAPSFADGNAVVPSPHPKSKTLSPLPTPRRLHKCFAAFAHGIRDTSKVPFFPERLVGIRECTSHESVDSLLIVSRLTPLGRRAFQRSVAAAVSASAVQASDLVLHFNPDHSLAGRPTQACR